MPIYQGKTEETRVNDIDPPRCSGKVGVHVIAFYSRFISLLQLQCNGICRFEFVSNSQHPNSLCEMKYVRKFRLLELYYGMTVGIRSCHEK